jgi:hypothetical protein
MPSALTFPGVYVEEIPAACERLQQGRNLYHRIRRRCQTWSN